MENILKIPGKYLIFLLLGLVGVVHASYLGNGFTWLDHGDIERGRAIIPLGSIGKAFVSPFADTYFFRPLQTVSLSLDHFLYGSKPAGYHLTNVLLHLLLVYIVYFFSGVFFPFDDKKKLVAALIFGIHPLSYLPAGAISYRPEILLGIFSLWTVYLYSRYRTLGKFPGLVFAASSFLAALFSKETALYLVPAMIVFYEIKMAANSGKEKEKKDLSSGNPKTALAVFLFGLLIYLFLRFISVGLAWRKLSYQLTLWQWIGVRLTSLGKLLFALISPFKPSLSDAVSTVGLINPYSILAVFYIPAVLMIIFKKGWQSRWSRAFILLSISLLPALNIIPLPRFYSPHYAYIPAIFYAILVVLLTERLKLEIILILYLLIMSVSTFSAGFLFKNDYSLFAAEVAKDDKFLEGHYYLGNYYWQKNNLQEAESEFDQALKKRENVIAFVDRTSLIINLAGVFVGQNKYEQARQLLISAKDTASPKQQQLILYNLALIYKLKEGISDHH